jgi:predicted SnoaL-like aldol condensation-catalyzing enzyme
MDAREAAERFARTWQDGWARHDTAAIAALYAEECVHRSMPFRPPHVGRDAVVDYIRGSFAEEPALDVRFSDPIVDGDRAVMEFRVTMIEAEADRPVTLAGCAFLRFADDGLVVEARDYWHTADGHREPTGTLFL